MQGLENDSEAEDFHPSTSSRKRFLDVTLNESLEWNIADDENHKRDQDGSENSSTTFKSNGNEAKGIQT